ncbi:MAG: tRNA (adenosine(37)-N6)-threonylcarbamoyltransferase complex transferase subunit TsaD [Nanoarchaeota archaeon]|nr:tRNA (adenosine(37)-N6)-threonylcarbamoyltransferase complex transferase subunit TsaD [Nanoarchaeota archaeon]
MIVLGIESTAHTFGIGILKDGKILADIKRQYRPEKGGIVPNDAMEFLKSVKEEILEEALKEAKLEIKDINIFAISQGPGMPLSLHIGMNFAKELAKKYKKPLIPVNHLVGHLSIGLMLTEVKDPVFILATGANTQIIAFEGGKYRVFGECLSIGLGNALDKFGRAIELEFPAGPKIEELAKKGKYIELSYVVKGMDVEFSGIVTQASNLYKKGAKKEDLCYSIQETCFAMLTEVSERAMAHCDKKELLLIGGVAANQRLIEMLEIMCKERNAEFKVVPIQYSGDCGGQIAVQGFLEGKNKKFSKKETENLDINPIWRVEEVEIKY